MYLETIKFVCEMVTKLCVFKHSPLVLKIAPTTTLKPWPFTWSKIDYDMDVISISCLINVLNIKNKPATTKCSRGT